MTYRTYRPGATGALMDEYERALNELKDVLRPIDGEAFFRVMDAETTDEDCRSICSVMNHTVRAGYGYANYIRKQFGDPYVERRMDYELKSAEMSCKQLDLMFAYTLEGMENKYDLTFEQVRDNTWMVHWGQQYDFEQMLEHAIVHILRHRRQIVRWLEKA